MSDQKAGDHKPLPQKPHPSDFHKSPYTPSWRAHKGEDTLTGWSLREALISCNGGVSQICKYNILTRPCRLFCDEPETRVFCEWEAVLALGEGAWVWNPGAPFPA